MAEKQKSTMEFNPNTMQGNIKKNTKDLTQYSLFLGGLNVKSKALEQYNPLKTGYNRIFMVKMPPFMKRIMPSETLNFKHLIEYAFKSISGISDLTMEYESITGGYAGRSFEIPTIMKDDTNTISINLQELSGSPIREYVEMWLSGVSDPQIGLATYHGALDSRPINGEETPGLEFAQFNHTAEAIYVATDPTGRSVEFACLLSNMMPKAVKRDHFNYESGSHNVVEVTLDFTCTMYTSPDVNQVAKRLLDKYKILGNYLDFKSDYLIGDGALADKTISDDQFPDANILDWTKGQ